MKLKSLLAHASMALCLPGVSMAAPTMYTYTGEFFATIEDSSEVPGSYTTGMRNTGFFILTDAIAPNTTFSASSPSDARILDFSFDNGRLQFNQGDNTTFPLGVSLTTNASGELSTWRISMNRQNPLPGIVQGDLGILNTTETNCGVFPCDVSRLIASFGPFAGDVARNDVPGSWTITPVPEPSTYAFFLAGIALVGFAVKRRTPLRH
jgi:hypothetical protein